MRFYIASRLELSSHVRDIADFLKAEGWTQTYDWTTHGSVQDEGLNRIREVAEKEAEGVRTADLVIIRLPGGRGTHAELGIALGARVPVLIVGRGPADLLGYDDRTCAFYHHPLVKGILHTPHPRVIAEWCRRKAETIYPHGTIQDALEGRR